MNDNNITKLPKWAQQRIRLLEGRLQEANRKLDETGKILTYREPGIGYNEGLERRSIPARSIGFCNDKGVLFNVSLDKTGKLEVNVTGYKDRMVIFPESSNHFTVGDSAP